MRQHSMIPSMRLDRGDHWAEQQSYCDSIRWRAGGSDQQSHPFGVAERSPAAKHIEHKKH